MLNYKSEIMLIYNYTQRETGGVFDQEKNQTVFYETFGKMSRKTKGTAVSLQAWGGPEGSRRFRLLVKCVFVLVKCVSVLVKCVYLGDMCVKSW